MSNAKSQEDHWVMSQLNKAGAEVMDPKPLFEKIGFKKPPSMEQKIQQMLSAQRIQMQEEMGIDPEEELNFEIDEDPDMLSPYEAEVLLMEEEQLDIEYHKLDQLPQKEPEPEQEPSKEGGEPELST